jgi:hypothetical protein
VVFKVFLLVLHGPVGSPGLEGLVGSSGLPGTEGCG